MFLSICTPAYNRDYTLERLYQSLVQQTCVDFEWIIIDDGSTDSTGELIDQFQNEGKITIRYHYQENQGKHIAINKALDIAKGELFTCLDSDDWYYSGTVEKIYKKWTKQIQRDTAGIISLDTYEDGRLVGKKLPKDIEKMNWIDLNFNYKGLGDKDYYIKTKILRDYKFPSYKNNKHMPPSYQYFLISKEYDFLLLNKPTKYVEYLDDGISKNKFNKYVVAPDNFARYRFEIMDLIPTFTRKVINAIHFNSSLLLGSIKLKPEKMIDKILVVITKPAGYILTLYIRKNVNKDQNISHRIEG